MGPLREDRGGEDHSARREGQVPKAGMRAVCWRKPKLRGWSRVGNGGVEQARVREVGEALCTQHRGFQLCCKCNKKSLESFMQGRP